MGRTFGVCSAVIGLTVIVVGCSRQAPTSPVAVENRVDLWKAGGAPATPPFNLEAVLRDVNGRPGFGLLKFRQPHDGDLTIYLDPWVRICRRIPLIYCNVRWTPTLTRTAPARLG